MIIGLDLDDTITELPEFFGIVVGALLDSGHEVHVITFREPGTEEGVRAELAELGIRYTDVHLPTGRCKAPEWKAGVAKELELDLMIDDSPEVLSEMPESVRRLWLCDPEIFNLNTCVRAFHGELGSLRRGDATD